MAKPQTLGDKLRRDAEKKHAMAVNERRLKEQAEYEAARAAAKERFKPELLEKEIKKTAKTGRLEMTLMSSSEFTKTDNAWLHLVGEWARANGMHVHSSESSDWEYGPTAFASICWRDHSNERRSWY